MDRFTEKELLGFSERLSFLKPGTGPRWGSMSVTQMLTHLNDAFRVCLGMKEATDRSNFVWNKILFPALVYGFAWFPQKAKAPAEINQQIAGSKPRDFYTELEFLKKMMDIFNEREGNKLKPHPLFGNLSKQQWKDLMAVHINHHLKQFGV